MGNTETKSESKEIVKFKAIPDKFKSLKEVQEALQLAGLESSNLILGIDYTISNVDAGEKTFGGKSLHSIDPTQKNPYQQVIDILGRTMEPFDKDNFIPVFGFGDSGTRDKAAFPFFNDRVCEGLEEVLIRYEELTPTIKLSGPTSFAPVIHEAIEIVKNAKDFHILIIIADGQVDTDDGIVTPDSEWCLAETETRRAIVDASEYPISIIVIGVGDGPWDKMIEFDNALPERTFDNFQFVEFHKVMSESSPEYQTSYFAAAVLQVFKLKYELNILKEVPDQYLLLKKLNYL